MADPTSNNPETPAPQPESPKSAAPPPVPQPAAKETAKAAPTRRFFLVRFFTSSMAIAWTSFAASMAAMTLGTLRFLIPNVLAEPPSQFKAGLPDDYEEDKVTDGFKEKNAWIVKHDGKIYALSTTCTHLGCTPNWLEREGTLKCPSNCSGFYING